MGSNVLNLRFSDKLYLSGAMASTNLPDKNFKQFFDAEKILKKYFEIVNPASYGNFGIQSIINEYTDHNVIKNKGSKILNGHILGNEISGWSNFLKRDIKLLLDCDGIIMLPGWDFYKSKGATLEKQIAESLEIKVFYYEDVLNFISQNINRPLEAIEGQLTLNDK